MPKDNSTAGNPQDITLRDVIMHVQNMQQQLLSNIEDVELRLSSAIAENTKGIAENTSAIRKLSIRIDTLEEDLTATITDTMKIRRHMGMAVPDET